MSDCAISKSTTAEGAPAFMLSAEQALRRSVMSCLLGESGYYEAGETITNRIASLIPKVAPETVSEIAIQARLDMNLRHIPLFIANEMARHKQSRYLVCETLLKIIKRPDDITKFMTLYWKDGKKPLCKQVKKALAKVFNKFDQYSLSKYANKKSSVKLRDCLFMAHPRPTSPKTAEIWKALIDDRLSSPDTWESALSSGQNRTETWTRLLNEKKLGTLALIRNLRNMEDCKVDRELVISALNSADVSDILPFRFLLASEYCSSFSKELEQMLFKSLKNYDQLKGHTVLLIDISGSMFSSLSQKSYMTRFGAGASLAILLTELCENITIYSFSETVAKIEPEKGFALFRKIRSSLPAGETFMGKAIEHVNSNEVYDRIIVISDEQSADTIPSPKSTGYMINVAPMKNGLGYGNWIHIDGFSVSICDFLIESEAFYEKHFR